MLKITDSIDGSATQELRLLIHTRFNWIDLVYSEVGSDLRMAALESLIHLIHELGWGIQDFDR